MPFGSGDRPRSILSIALAALLMALAGSIAAGFWGFHAGLYAATVELCLALGLWMTEKITAVFTRTEKFSSLAVLLLGLGKLLWWAGIFLAARHAPKNMEKPIALSIGVFLLALSFSSWWQQRKARISDGNSRSQP